MTGPRLDPAAPEGTLVFGELAPNPRLAAVIERYWSLEVRTTPTTVRVLPDARVDLVFDAGPPVTAWVVAPRLSPIVYTHNRPTSLLGASLHAVSAEAVLGAPAGALMADWQPLSDVLGPVAELLAEALGREPSPAGRVGVLEVFLAARLAAAPLDGRVASAGSDSLPAGELLEVVRSARRAGASPRNLVRLFRGWLGVGPRRFARIVRAEAARRRLAAGVSALAAVAELGFTAPEELEREVGVFTGERARALATRLHGLGDAAEP